MKKVWKWDKEMEMSYIQVIRAIIKKQKLTITRLQQKVYTKDECE